MGIQQRRQPVFSKLKCAHKNTLVQQPLLCEKLKSFAVRTENVISYFVLSYPRWNFTHGHIDLHIGTQRLAWCH